MRFDLRWKHALGLGLEDEGFDATVLCRFRRKLLDRGLERKLFERLVNAAREAGLITKGAAQLLDSSHILGAAGARDTYALIRGGIRKLLKALGYTPTRRAELGEKLSWYLDPEAPEKPHNIDWSDAEARTAHLKEIVADAKAALSLVECAGSATPAANEAAALLSPRSSPMTRKRGHLRVRNAGAAHPKKRRKSPSVGLPSSETLPPRIVVPGCGAGWPRIASSAWWIPRDARGAQEQAPELWAGYKIHPVEEPESELITSVEVRPANEYDADAALGLIRRQQETVGLLPEELLYARGHTAQPRCALIWGNLEWK